MMEKEPKPKEEGITRPEPYTNKKGQFRPESVSKGMKRYELNSLIHGVMTVSDTREWDDDMHLQVDKLSIGETVVLTSGAYEYMKVTRTADGTFDAEHGTYDEPVEGE